LTIFFFYVSFPAGQAHHGTNSSTTYHIRSTYTTLLSATRARTVVHTVVSFNLFLIDQYLEDRPVLAMLPRIDQSRCFTGLATVNKPSKPKDI
jgi:hypothetical protein